MRTRPLVLLLLASLLGCGTQAEADPPRPEARQAPPVATSPVDALGPAIAGEAADFRWGDEIFHFLSEDGEVVDRAPWGACLGSGCWDGAPGLSGPIPSVGSPDALYVAFDYPGWRFHRVTFNPVDDDCGGRSITVRATPVTDRIFRIDPAGLRGEWRVDVFGRGPAGGDAVTSVRWRTPSDGTLPVPEATGSLFPRQDGHRVAPYGGPELSLADLARTPTDATAVWTVTDSEGHAVTVPLRRTTGPCERDGAVAFRGRELTPAKLDRLVGDDLTYAVQLTLDGTDYRGTARWPRDETAEPPSTRFTFEPPLPAYRSTSWPSPTRTGSRR